MNQINKLKTGLNLRFGLIGLAGGVFFGITCYSTYNSNYVWNKIYNIDKHRYFE